MKEEATVTVDIDECEEQGLPQGWVQTTLGDITCTERRAVNPRQYPHLKFIGMEHVEPHTMRLIGTVNSCEVRSNAETFGPGDVLYGRLRPYLNKVIYPDFSGLCSAEFIVFRKVTHLDSKYVQYFLNSWEFVSFATHLNEGDRPRVSFDQLADHPFPLPPLSEQHRIVAEIEKQFSRLDAGTSALKQVQVSLRRYRASVLQAACEGRLVPQDPSDEPASELLKRILAERRAKWEAQQLAKMQELGKVPTDDKWKQKYQDPTEPNLAGLAELPKGKVWIRLDQVSHFVTSGSRYWSQFYSDHGALFIRAQDVKTDKLNLETVTFVDLPESAEGIRARVTENDLLVTITGANVTKTARVQQPLDEAYVSQHVALVRPINGICSKYLHLWIISSSHGRRMLQQKAYGAGKPGLSLDNVRDLLVVLPPLAEQHRIVAEVERRLSVVDELEAIIQSNLKRANRMRQSIFKRAIEGKLVPQDSNDEPADVLLERIRAERQSTSARVTRRKNSTQLRLPLPVQEADN